MVGARRVFGEILDRGWSPNATNVYYFNGWALEEKKRKKEKRGLSMPLR